LRFIEALAGRGAGEHMADSILHVSTIRSPRDLAAHTTGRSGEVATLVVPLADQAMGAMKRFGGDGMTLSRTTPPRLEPQVGKSASARRRSPWAISDRFFQPHWF
jgi:hypothetical protein